MIMLINLIQLMIINFKKTQLVNSHDNLINKPTSVLDHRIRKNVS